MKSNHNQKLNQSKIHKNNTSKLQKPTDLAPSAHRLPNHCHALQSDHADRDFNFRKIFRSSCGILTWAIKTLSQYQVICGDGFDAFFYVGFLFLGYG